jgi:hypothetical protein
MWSGIKPLLAMLGGSAGGACSWMILGLVVPWRLAGRPAFPTLDGFLVLGLFGAIIGALLGTISLPIVLLCVRSVPSRGRASLAAGIASFAIGLLCAWVCAFFFLHLPVELRNR